MKNKISDKSVRLIIILILISISAYILYVLAHYTEAFHTDTPIVIMLEDKNGQVHVLPSKYNEATATVSAYFEYHNLSPILKDAYKKNFESSIQGYYDGMQVKQLPDSIKTTADYYVWYQLNK